MIFGATAVGHGQRKGFGAVQAAARRAGGRALVLWRRWSATDGVASLKVDDLI